LEHPIALLLLLHGVAQRREDLTGRFHRLFFVSIAGLICSVEGASLSLDSASCSGNGRSRVDCSQVGVMPDRTMASRLAKTGFDLWQEGRLEEAVERYREALTVADPDYFATPEYHSELAHVLAALGLDDLLHQVICEIGCILTAFAQWPQSENSRLQHGHDIGERLVFRHSHIELLFACSRYVLM
jgi:hypothetical protein